MIFRWSIQRKSFVKRAPTVHSSSKGWWINIPGQVLAAVISNLKYKPPIWAQLEHADGINGYRTRVWQRYNTGLAQLAAKSLIRIPNVPADCLHNGHCFPVRCRDEETRDDLLAHLNSRGIGAVFHYIPLHSSPGGLEFTRFHGEDVWTSTTSTCLLRLPLWHGISDQEIDWVIESMRDFLNHRRLR